VTCRSPQLVQEKSRRGPDQTRIFFLVVYKSAISSCAVATCMQSMPARFLNMACDIKPMASMIIIQVFMDLPVQEEERLWTDLIRKYGDLNAPWVNDVVGRAYGNRGNARTRQGKFDVALTDFNTAIARCPWSADPVLNRSGPGMFLYCAENETLSQPLVHQQSHVMIQNA
jgi:hypothetical protein